MKKLLILLTLILSASGAYAEKYGAGFVLGDPCALVGRAFLTGTDCVDAGAGEAEGDGLYLYGDYRRIFRNITTIPELSFNLGIGAAFHDWDGGKKHDDENRVECRVPFGVEYLFTKVPVGVFAELAPALRVIPDIDFGIRGGIGARYYFK